MLDEEIGLPLTLTLSPSRRHGERGCYSGLMGALV